MTQEQLNKIIENHQHYLNEDIDGWESMRADLSDKNLSGLNLKNANLREANFRNANLSNSNLGDANLNNADLAYADLRKADLKKADLRKADLREVDLRNSDLSRADLRNANLREANLFRANLKDANLFGVNLKNANISYAKINANTKIDYPIACPETGSFIGYKKAGYEYIVKLKICGDAKRSSATAKKCRCSKALVLSIENIDGSDSGLQEIESDFDSLS